MRNASFIKDIYLYTRKCHTVYTINYDEVFYGNNYQITSLLPCETYIPFNRGTNLGKENLVYRCRECYVVMCEYCGPQYQQEPYEETNRRRNENCGRYTIIDTTAKKHLGSNLNEAEYYFLNVMNVSMKQAL